MDPLPVELLKRFTRIAVVGMSASPGKDAHDIPAYMAQHGYDVFPVNPSGAKILGNPAYARLEDVPRPLEIVSVFRPSAEAEKHVRLAIELGAKAIWLPLEVESPAARAFAQDEGVPYVENTCLRTTHRLHVRA